MTRKPSRLRPTVPMDIFYICHNMRQDEVEQLRAFFPMDEYDPDEAALMFLNKGGPKMTLVDENDMPICVGGYESVSEGVMQSWMAGTMEGWQKHWRSITKSSLWMIEQLFMQGIARVQTNALASRVGACEWYVKSLGMTYEGTWRKFGRQGQDVACFSRLAED